MRLCIFCSIANKHSPQSQRIIYEDDQVYVVPDIHPHAQAHFLVITKQHIRDVHVLGPNHIDLLKHMMEVGQSILAQSGEYKNVKYGFHVRPFHSVNHLHLHCLGLPYLSCLDRIIFHAPFFVKAKKVLQKLEKKKSQQ